MKLKNSIVILVFIVWLFWAVLYIGNHHICSTTFEVKSPKIPEEFNGYTIVQVSDLHNTKFGKNQARLIKRIEQNKPNVIVITGDLIYKRSKDMEKEISEVTDFVNNIVKIAPVYFVTGNHENQVGKENLKKIRESLANSGVTLLDETSTKLNFKGKHINLAGINDLEMYFDDYVDEYIKNSGKKIITIEEVIMIEENIIKRCLDKIKLDDSEFNVLLTHQPQYIEIYAKYKYDLVFSGHAHGGQIRLPFIGPLMSPGQGFFPKYTSGLHTFENTKMIISRGLGKSKLPFRFLNDPELIICKLSSESTNADYT